MSPPESSHRERLEALLVDASLPPDELVEEIASTRQDVVIDERTSRELDRLELQFLLDQAKQPGAVREVCDTVDAARRADLGLERRCLELTEAGDPAALFDLAEVRAECLHLELASEAEACGRLIEERLDAVASAGGVLEEARERWAALSTEEEDLALPHTIALQRETSVVMRALAARTGEPQLRRLARRLERSANDRALAQRLEGLLGRRGATVLETTSFVFLLAVLVLILIEATLPLSEDALYTMHMADAVICLFFITEFLFKLALSPARGSWFLRNVVTDLIPAVPAALWLPFGAVSGAESAAAVRVLRLLRISWAVRYVQALQPLLRLFRLVLFLIRGMDGLVQRFSRLLNRNFVFFEQKIELAAEATGIDDRPLMFRALRREHVLLEDMPEEQRGDLLRKRAVALQQRTQLRQPASVPVAVHPTTLRDIPVEQAVEQLSSLQPEELSLWMSRRELLALDRVVRVLNAPVVCQLPVIRRLRIGALPATAEERVVALARRVADWLQSWQNRLLFVADLHGIVTGPQILDRVATTMVKASQRPAVRLLLFGGLFSLLKLLIGDNFLSRFVGAPLIILGSVCLVFFVLGKWLKQVAGEAAETFKLTSEAHFIALMHLVKRRHETADLEFLARRIFRWELEGEVATAVLQRQVHETRQGTEQPGPEAPLELREDINRVVLLYLHFLDGAILHESDIKSTEQLLANLSLENIRYGHLGFSRRDRKRLRRLSLEDGSMLSGPYMWFRFITESVAVETAKRITEYNRNCLTREQRQVASSEQVARMDAWLEKRRDAARGRTLERQEAPGKGLVYLTTEFNALDFLSADPDRDALIGEVFGDGVLEALRVDRRTMIREIFGMRPLHERPRSERSFNFYRFYLARLSMGRVFLMPLYMLFQVVRTAGMAVKKTAQIVREILAPELAMRARERGRATFSVALRKIHRMKAPGLLEAMRTRALFDPAYSGAPPTWSDGLPFEQHSEVERDMDFLDLREREREELRALAAANRRRVQEWQGIVRKLPTLTQPGESEFSRRLGERAVIVSFMTNRRSLRDLFRAEGWFEGAVLTMESKETRIRGSRLADLGGLLVRPFRRHPVDVWLRKRVGHRHISWRGRRNFKKAYYQREYEVRAMVHCWLDLPAGQRPFEAGVERAREAYNARSVVSRELAALRAVQSLSVLDVRNYRTLVFRLGGFADDGEDPERATALP